MSGKAIKGLIVTAVMLPLLAGCPSASMPTTPSTPSASMPPGGSAGSSGSSGSSSSSSGGSSGSSSSSGGGSSGGGAQGGSSSGGSSSGGGASGGGSSSSGGSAGSGSTGSGSFYISVHDQHRYSCKAVTIVIYVYFNLYSITLHTQSHQHKRCIRNHLRHDDYYITFQSLYTAEELHC